LHVDQRSVDVHGDGPDKRDGLHLHRHRTQQRRCIGGFECLGRCHPSHRAYSTTVGNRRPQQHCCGCVVVSACKRWRDEHHGLRRSRVSRGTNLCDQRRTDLYGNWADKRDGLHVHSDCKQRSRQLVGLCSIGCSNSQGQSDQTQKCASLIWEHDDDGPLGCTVARWRFLYCQLHGNGISGRADMHKCCRFVRLQHFDRWPVIHLHGHGREFRRQSLSKF